MRHLATICSVLLCVPLAACATSASTSKFHGAEHSVAQTVANLQSDVTGGEQKKICENDLAAGVVTKLGGKKGCETAIKSQLSEIDSTEVQVESVHVEGGRASATVKSVHKGKKKESTLTLLLESGKWKISALQ